MKKLNLVNSLSIAERMAILVPYYKGKEKEVGNQLIKWRKRKSLCTQKHFEDYTQLLGIDPKEFDIGIKRLDSEDRTLLWGQLQETAWFKLNKKIFAQTEPTSQMEPTNFSYFTRFHMSYFETQLKKQSFLKFKFSEVSFKRLLEHTEKELLALSLKALIFDLHEEKKKRIFEGDSPEARFRFYIATRFSTAQSVETFLEEYPVLWRLLAERLQFHIDNFFLFITSLEESFEALKELFKLSTPAHILIDSWGNSDSHEKAKTVILFQINQQKLVFKYKNLEVGQRWNEFLSIIEQHTNSSFYQLKRHTSEAYTIEEFVETVSCVSQKEVSDYYYSFGEYTAICYFLCGSDFHAENIIACGDKPVLIDIETLLQNESPLVESDSLCDKEMLKKNQSVVSTSLLPITCFTNRIEPEVKIKNERIGEMNMSGFSGDKQLLPFKVLTLVEENTDNVHFEYVEHYSEEKQNIPILNGEKVDPQNYVNSVIKGFVAQYDFFVSNKQFLVSKIKEVFENTKVRCILKPTQQYYDMLGYSNHSSCMKDYLEREKLFENYWAFSYKDKRAIHHEIEDLLINDIPIFFTNVSTNSLFTSRGEEIRNYYSMTSLDRLQNRIEALSEEDKNYQLVMLSSSLKNNCNERFSYKLSESPKKQIEDIVQHILKRGIIDNQQQKVLFLDFILENEKKIFDVAAINFYDGLVGIYVFLLFYNHYYLDQGTQEMLQALEKELFENIETQLTSCSVYVGALSKLVALYYRYFLMQDASSLNLAVSLVTEISSNAVEIDDKVDWLTGISGLISLLAGFYRLTNNLVFIRLAKQLATQLDLSEIKLNGVAHGYSGVIVALNELRQLLKETERDPYSQMIQECLASERTGFDGNTWKDFRENTNYTTQWCHGCTGIGLARLELIKSKFSNMLLMTELIACVDNVLMTDLKDDCLCHGNTGSYIFLSEVYKTGYMNKERNNQIYKRLAEIECKLLFEAVTIEGMKGYPNLGLMTGISGIGFHWLRTLQSDVPNLLLLK